MRRLCTVCGVEHRERGYKCKGCRNPVKYKPKKPRIMNWIKAKKQLPPVSTFGLLIRAQTADGIIKGEGRYTEDGFLWEGTDAQNENIPVEGIVTHWINLEDIPEPK